MLWHFKDLSFIILSESPNKKLNDHIKSLDKFTKKLAGFKFFKTAYNL